jgi:hypothetical protein
MYLFKAILHSEETWSSDLPEEVLFYDETHYREAAVCEHPQAVYMYAGRYSSWELNLKFKECSICRNISSLAKKCYAKRYF